MAPVEVTVNSRSGKQLAQLAIDSQASVEELKKEFHGKVKAMYPARQRFTLPPKPGEKSGVALKDGGKLSDYGLKDGSVLLFKDLGLQIPYATVFFWEYFGPMVVYPLFYLFPQYCYPWYKGPVTHRVAQQVAVMYWVFHYAKRIIETFTVHRFGHATMPVFNLFKNCSYYWGFAAFVSYFVNHPLYTPPPEGATMICFVWALLCQASNYWCHIVLANLRKPGDKGYSIPKGFLFNYITCANYTTEIAGWVLFSIGTSCVPAAMFTAAGAYQMAIWARQKHRRLQKIFDGKEGREKYPKRWIMIPPIY